MIFDTNRDGVLSAEEINNGARGLKQMDRNRDGKLTSDEMPRPRFGPGGSRGEPGRSERGRPGEADRDGKARPERPGQADRPRRSEGQRRRGGDQAPSPERFLQRFDRNKDGKVQASELPEGLKRLFERGDTNQDGELDRAEDRELDDLALASENAIGVDVDDDAPVGCPRELFAEDFETPHGRLVRRAGGACLQDEDRIPLGPAARSREADRDQEGMSTTRHRSPNQRGSMVTVSGKSVINTWTAIIAATGRTVQPATSLTL